MKRKREGRKGEIGKRKKGGRGLKRKKKEVSGEEEGREKLKRKKEEMETR